jgi:capsular exopolysaccharide synthesis family protein
MEPYVLPAMAGPPATSGAFTGAEVYRVIRQRLVMILFLWLFFITATAVGTYVWIRYWPVYRAMALVRVQSITPANPLEPLKPQEAREDEVSRLLQDQSLQVMSPEVLDNVIADPLIRETTWFKEAEKKKAEKDEDPFDLLSDIVKADPVPESNLLSISVSWKVKDETPKLVNTVVDKYMAVIENAQKNKIRKASDTLGVEVTRAKRDYDQKQADLDSFRSNVESTGTGRDELKEKVLTLTAIETELAMDMDGKRTIYEQFQDANPDDLPITPDLQAILNSDPTIVQLENQARAAEADLNTALSRFGPKHRVVQQQQAARDAAMDRAAEERRMKTLQYQINQLDQARTNYLEAQAQLLAIRERLSGAQAELLDKEQKYSSYLRLEEETKTLKENYLRLVEQQQFVMMTLNQEHTVQITPLGQAKVPNRRSSPKWEILLPVGIIFGLALSIGFALLLEMADKSVRTPRDVQRQSMTVLATIPAVEDDEVEISRVETASLDAPQSITAEAFRTLRANLFFCAPPEQQAALLVTSPSGGNGKTTVAVNLAISIALSGRRVLLIDANFRRPCLPRIFPDMRPDGLSNILIGQSHLDDCVMATSVPGLDVLGAGPLPPNPAELLGSTYLRDMLADARARYDQVIFDGPPVLLVSDAMVLSGAVDGVLLICQYRSTSRGALQRTQQQLDAINARIFGAVLNRVETRAGGYFREAYREFYEYSEMPEDAGGEAKQLDADAADQLQSGEGTPADEAPREGDDQNLLATDPHGTESAGDTQDTQLSADGGTETNQTLEDASQAEEPIDVDAEIASIGGESILADEDLALDDDTPSIDDETNPEDPHRA